MDTLNERIKKVRKDLELSQKDFAEKIGISQRSVSWGEQPGNNVPDSTIKSLCLAFHVNEKWLRDGSGEMYIQPTTFSLDAFVRQHNGTELEIDILKTYFELPIDIRKMLLEHFKSHLNISVNKESKINTDNDKTVPNPFDGAPDTPEDLEDKYPPIDDENEDAG